MPNTTEQIWNRNKEAMKYKNQKVVRTYTVKDGYWSEGDADIGRCILIDTGWQTDSHYASYYEEGTEIKSTTVIEITSPNQKTN